MVEDVAAVREGGGRWDGSGIMGLRRLRWIADGRRMSLQGYVVDYRGESLVETVLICDKPSAC